MSTPGHHVWELLDDATGEDVLVGHLWLAVRDRLGYLYDIELLPAARGRGLGRASMRAAEEAARGLGADVLRLNVFGHNSVARGLYERLGYGVVSAVHTRGLGPEDACPGGLDLSLPAQVNPGHEVWAATREGRVVASVCLHWSRAGAGGPVEAHDLRAEGGDRTELLRALVGLAAGRGAGAVAAETSDPGGWSDALAAAGFTLTAELRERPLAPDGAERVHGSGGAAR